MARQMKNSGIEWIGTIPSEWEIRRNKTLFDCSKEIVGKASEETQLLSLTTQGVKTKSQDTTGGKVPESFDTYQTVMPDDIVMCLFDLDCSAVFSGISPYYGMISPAYKIIKCKSGLLPKYADYWFKFVFDGRKFKSYAKNLRYTLNYDEFAVLPFALPNLSEQGKIVSYLDKKCSEIDDVISKTKSTIEEYKRLRQAMIANAVTKGIRANREMKDSGIKWTKKIPVEWDSIAPKALFALRKDKAQAGEKQLTASQQYGVIYQDEYMELTGTRIVTVEKDFDILKHVDAGDFVISMRSFQGGLEYSEKSGSISSAYVMLIPDLNLVYPSFYKWLFKSSVYINALQSTSNLVRDGQAMRYSNFAQVRLYTVPLDEQKEIADYLDKKCAEIDTLIEKKTALLAEMETYKKSVIYEYVTGKKEVGTAEQSAIAIGYPYFPAVLNTDKARFAQAVLMSRILDKCRKKMGRVKLEKMLYTIECSIGFDFDTEYAREAAGPLDTSIYECEGIISRKNRWYDIKSSKHSVSYIPTKNHSKYEKYYNKYFGEYDAEIARIIDIFMDYEADHAEIIATLFAAWNDAIIDRKQASDEEIVDNVLNNWNESKKRFPRDMWLRAIAQMRKHNLIPKGYGKHTVIKIKLDENTSPIREKGENIWNTI